MTMKPLKKNLVIAAVGDRSRHREWLGGKTYDTYLIYFGDKEQGCKGEARFHKFAKGYKYHLIKDVLDSESFIENYEYVWLPDDDLLTRGPDIDKLFQFMKEYDLWVAQPSIMGWYGVDITLHQKGSLVRFTNWVEIMCPCFSQAALQTCKKVFKENKTGWSIETIWNVLLGHPRDKIAIIDDIVVFHSRPVLTGDTHKDRADPLKEAMAEAEAVYEKWKLGPEMRADTEHGQRVDSEVWCAVVYKQIMKEMEEGIPKQERFWPPCDWLKNEIEWLKS